MDLELRSRFCIYFLMVGFRRNVPTIMQDPLISILIPVYNAQPFLKECLESVLSQTYTRLEIICIDDGSTDKSAEILRACANKDKRLRVFYQKNQGIACTRNRLLRKVKGEYIAFVDSDDKIDVRYIERLYRAARQTNSEVVRALYTMKDMKTGKSVPCEQVFREFLRPCPGLRPVERIQVAFDDSQVWLKLIKTSLVTNHRLQFLNKSHAEDISFEILLYLYATGITFLPEHLYTYRVGTPASASSNKSNWAQGTLENLVFVCEQLQVRKFTDPAGWNLLCRNLVQAIRRMRKFALTDREGELCRRAVHMLRQVLPYCGGYIRWKLRLFCWCSCHVGMRNIPYVAWGFR